jgi:hypothetical protein
LTNVAAAYRPVSEPEVADAAGLVFDTQLAVGQAVMNNGEAPDWNTVIVVPLGNATAEAAGMNTLDVPLELTSTNSPASLAESVYVPEPEVLVGVMWGNAFQPEAETLGEPS